MSIEKINIEDRNLEVYHKNLLDNPYCVYNNKIWRITSKSGAGLNYTMGLTREKHNEQIYIKGDMFKDVKYVLKPTGYMDV